MFIFFAEGSCDNFKNDVVLPIAPIIIVKYFRKNIFKNKLTRVYLPVSGTSVVVHCHCVPNFLFVHDSFLG